MLQKLLFKSGCNQENTRYTNEGAWYSSDKVRFRQGTPEKIGGWQQISTNTFLGLCRSLWAWVTLGGLNLVGVGTNSKFYIERGGAYNDITPIRDTAVLNGPFTATDGSSVVTVADTAHGATTGSYVTFSGAASLGGNVTAAVLNAEYAVTVIDANSYTITVPVVANSSDTGHGGASVTAAYQINIGPAIVVPTSGWGAGTWGSGTWGVGSTSTESLRLWNQDNFGEDLIFSPRGGALYYWDATNGVTTRGVLVSSLLGATDVPAACNGLLVSDINRFVLLFGAPEAGSSTINPMLVRWADQESVTDWDPTPTNQAGELPLSHGSRIVTAIQNRQEIVILTDSTVYSMQYVGPPYVWGAQLLADNTSIVSPNAVALASGVVYWMGIDKFYKYDGRVQTLNCDLRQYVFGDFNTEQADQVFSGTNEGFNEVWWFYCSQSSTAIDRYVVYNYMENVWYYGTMARTAWLDSGLRAYPLAATYSNNLVNHEFGVDDGTSTSPTAIEAYITSSEFDIGDGNSFGFVWRVLPDITFRGSSATNPTATLSLLALQNSGSGYNDPESVGGSNSGSIVRTATVPVEQFTGQVNIRIRGRQMSLKIASDGLGVAWQLGAPRIDVRPDGRR